jgi:hypothetical protein
MLGCWIRIRGRPAISQIEQVPSIGKMRHTEKGLNLPNNIDMIATSLVPLEYIDNNQRFFVVIHNPREDQVLCSWRWLRGHGFGWIEDECV